MGSNLAGKDRGEKKEKKNKEQEGGNKKGKEQSGPINGGQVIRKEEQNSVIHLKRRRSGVKGIEKSLC